MADNKANDWIDQSRANHKIMNEWATPELILLKQWIDAYITSSLKAGKVSPFILDDTEYKQFCSLITPHMQSHILDLPTYYNKYSAFNFGFIISKTTSPFREDKPTISITLCTSEVLSALWPNEKPDVKVYQPRFEQGSKCSCILL